MGAQWESLVTLMGTPHVIRELAAVGGGFKKQNKRGTPGKGPPGRQVTQATWDMRLEGAMGWTGEAFVPLGRAACLWLSSHWGKVWKGLRSVQIPPGALPDSGMLVPSRTLAPFPLPSETGEASF